MAVMYPVTTRTRTWYSRGNVPLPDNSSADNVRKSLIFLLKNLLIGAETGGTTDSTRPASTYWTVVSSSDGVTSGASDLWGTTFNASKIVSGANKSWMILRSPSGVGSMYCTILFYSGGSQHISFHTSAPTGGNATTYPTITAYSPGWSLFSDGGYYDKTAALAQILDVNTTAHLGHFTINDLGGFHYAVSRTASANREFHFWGYYDKAVDYQTGDTYPYWCGYSAGTIAGGTVRGAGWYGTTSTHSRGYDGSTTGNQGSVGSGLMNFIYPTGSLRPGRPDQLAGVHTCMPTNLMRISSAQDLNNAWSGRLPDVYTLLEAGSASYGANIGASVPNSSAPTHHVVGDFLVPFGVVPTLSGGSSGNASFSVPKLADTQYPTATPPTVAVVSPTLGNISATDSLVFDVTDSDGFTELVVAVSFANGDYEIAHDGTSFSTKYSTNSTRAAISGGYRYTLKRFNNWHSSPTVKVFPVDTLGAGSS